MFCSLRARYHTRPGSVIICGDNPSWSC